MTTAAHIVDLFDPLTLGSDLLAAGSSGKWYTANHSPDLPKHITPQLIDTHWAGRRPGDLVGAAPAPWTRWQVWDIDVNVDKPDVPGQRITAADVTCRLTAYLANHDITPVVVTTPTGGYHVIVVAEAPVARGALGTWAQRIRDRVCPDPAEIHIDLRPEAAGGATKVRIPLGRGIAKTPKGEPRSTTLLDTRLLDPDALEPLHESRFEDLQALRTHLDAARVSIADIYSDPEAAGYETTGSGWVLSAARRAEIVDAAVAARLPIREPTNSTVDDSPISLSTAATVPLVRVLPVAETLNADDLYGPGWLSAVGRIQAGEILPGSEGLYKSVYQLTFYHYISEGQPEADVMAALTEWAEENGESVKKVSGMVRRSIKDLDLRVAAGELAIGLRTTAALLGVRDARPRTVVPRLLAEDLIVTDILSRVPAYLREMAGLILAEIRAHCTINQTTINALPGARKRRQARAGDAGDVVVRRARGEDEEVRSTIGVLAREALVRTGVVRRLKAHSTGHHSAIFGIDYATALEVRTRLGLPGITEGGELVHRTDDPVVHTAASGDTAVNAKGEESIHPARVAQLLLGDGLLERLVEDRPEIAEVAYAVARNGSVRPDEVDENLLPILEPYFGRTAQNRIGAHFPALRAARRELALPEHQLRWEGEHLAAPFVPKAAEPLFATISAAGRSDFETA